MFGECFLDRLYVESEEGGAGETALLLVDETEELRLAVVGAGKVKAGAGCWGGGRGQAQRGHHAPRPVLLQLRRVPEPALLLHPLRRPVLPGLGSD